MGSDSPSSIMTAAPGSNSKSDELWATRMNSKGRYGVSNSVAELAKKSESKIPKWMA